MNRKDLRTSESDWRATKQPTNRPMPAPKKSGIKLLSVLWIVALIITLAVLWETKKQCEINAIDQLACTD